MEAQPTFAALSAAGDGLGLLIAHQTIGVQLPESKNISPTAFTSRNVRFYLFSQKPNMTTQAYLEAFQNSIDVIEQSGGTIGVEPGSGTSRCTAETNAVIANMNAAALTRVRHWQQPQRHDTLQPLLFLVLIVTRFGRMIET